MPRRPAGPKLVKLKKKGFTQGVWYVRYRKNGNKTEVTTGLTCDRKAEEFFQEVWLPEYSRQQRKSDVQRDPGHFLILDALLDYADEHAPKTTAPERIAYAIDALSPFWQDYTVDDITPELCKRYCTDREVSDWTTRRELGVLRAALNHARKNKRILFTPYVELPPMPDGKERWLTRKEVAALLRATRTPQARLYMPLFIMIALYTGARKSAVLELKWDRVDLVRNRIDLNPSDRKKTKKGRGKIPIPRRLRTFLLYANQRRGDCDYVIHRHGEKLYDIKKGFHAAALRAGFGDVTPHTLRHTAGTWMAIKGVDMFDIAKYLGHTTARTTELYAHHHPDHLKDAARAFE